jgi:hypothetical protein
MTETTGCPLCGERCNPTSHPYGVIIGRGQPARPMSAPEDTDSTPTPEGD